MKKLALLVLIFTNSLSLNPTQPPVVQPQFLHQYAGQYYKPRKPISTLKIVGVSVGASVVTSTLVATVISFVMCKVRL